MGWCYKHLVKEVILDLKYCLLDSVARRCLFYVRISVCVPSKPWCPLVVVICVEWQIVGHRGSTEIPLVPANHHCIDSVIFLRAPRFAGKSRMQSWGS